MTEHDDERGAEDVAAPRAPLTVPEGMAGVPVPVKMPDFIRDAIAKQGKVDPDEIERQAALVDLDAPLPGEQPPPPPPKQDALDLGIPIPTNRSDA